MKANLWVARFFSGADGGQEPKTNSKWISREGANARKLSRRQFVAATAATSAALITAPYGHGANAAGKLTLGFWDHWVPGANKTSTDLVNEWAAKEKVEVSIDYITSQGNKLILTAAEEAQAKSGHDILTVNTWRPQTDADLLEPMNDIMDPLIKQNGQVNDTVKYLGQADGKWLGVPASIGSQIKGPCSRIDLMTKYANIDVQAMYPAGSPPKADNWTMDTFLKAAGSATRPVSPSASVSARPPTAWIPPARSSVRSAQNSSMPRAISPSRPTPFGRRIQFSISDQLTVDKAKQLIADLEAQKLALHLGCRARSSRWAMMLRMS